MHQLRNRVRNRLLYSINRRITKIGLVVPPSCQQQIEKMISVGVTRLEHQRALDREEHILMSEQNLAKCVTVMQDQANVMGTFPEVTDAAFDQMQKQLSPMWPFC